MDERKQPTWLTPKLFSVMKAGYTRAQFLHDLTAGLVVGIVALPLAIAFAIASGVGPERGIYTAISAGLIVSLLGGSRVQIAGPTGAFIVIVYGIIQKYGYDGLAVATLIAGVLLMLMGFARLGTLLKFVPYPLIVGFTSGIAVIIFSSQINDALGLGLRDLPADFVEKWIAMVAGIGRLNPAACAVGAGSLLIVIFWPRVSRRVPGPLVAIIAATAVVQYFHLPVDTIGSRFGAVATGIPAPHMPQVTWQTVTRLISPAITIALLGGIESLLSAVVADGMIRSRHRPNIELVAQGVANIFSPLFGGIPATGAIARTATNVRNGGRTPVAGIVHALTILLVVLFFGRWASLIPLPALSAILMVVAYNMSEWRSFRKVLRSPRGDVAVMLLTFILTVLVDLTVAIEAGIVLASLLFMARMAEVSQVQALTRDMRDEHEEEEDAAGKPVVPEGVEVFEVYGSLFFGAVDQFTEALRSVQKKPKVLILETKNLLVIDATGLRAFEDLATRLAQEQTRFIVSGIHKQPLFAMSNAGLFDRIGEDNFCGSLDEAIARATAVLTDGAR